MIYFFMSCLVTSVFTFKIESTFDEWAAIFDSAEADKRHSEFDIKPLFRQEHIDLYSNAVKRQKDNYKGELLERRRNAVAYNKLISAVCKK